MAWSDRVRVVERTRMSVFQRGVTFSDGFAVELRFSGDGDPERWDSPMQAAISGPPALVDMLDEARDMFATREAAEDVARRLVAALESAESWNANRGG